MTTGKDIYFVKQAETKIEKAASEKQAGLVDDIGRYAGAAKDIASDNLKGTADSVKKTLLAFLDKHPETKARVLGLKSSLGDSVESFKKNNPNAVKAYQGAKQLVKDVRDSRVVSRPTESGILGALGLGAGSAALAAIHRSDERRKGRKPSVWTHPLLWVLLGATGGYLGGNLLEQRLYPGKFPTKREIAAKKQEDAANALKQKAKDEAAKAERTRDYIVRSPVVVTNDASGKTKIVITKPVTRNQKVKDQEGTMTIPATDKGLPDVTKINLSNLVPSKGTQVAGMSFFPARSYANARAYSQDVVEEGKRIIGMNREIAGDQAKLDAKNLELGSMRQQRAIEGAKDITITSAEGRELQSRIDELAVKINQAKELANKEREVNERIKGFYGRNGHDAVLPPNLIKDRADVARLRKQLGEAADYVDGVSGSVSPKANGLLRRLRAQLSEIKATHAGKLTSMDTGIGNLKSEIQQLEELIRTKKLTSAEATRMLENINGTGYLAQQRGKGAIEAIKHLARNFFKQSGPYTFKDFVKNCLFLKNSKYHRSLTVQERRLLNDFLRRNSNKTKMNKFLLLLPIAVGFSDKIGGFLKDNISFEADYTE